MSSLHVLSAAFAGKIWVSWGTALWSYVYVIGWNALWLVSKNISGPVIRFNNDYYSWLHNLGSCPGQKMPTLLTETIMKLQELGKNVQARPSWSQQPKKDRSLKYLISAQTNPTFLGLFITACGPAWCWHKPQPAQEILLLSVFIHSFQIPKTGLWILQIFQPCFCKSLVYEAADAEEFILNIERVK